eukprot:TRINITY_DN12595_c0_g4_i1.p1 TRINITY_DN12595_c0_g4~~TRINITY_DN12595_c0_g4_i1.p1  ORF type:complete len:1288 (+),score=379.94 TRINITY_DN12595_c0_g4_i1:88-3951(+)
MVWADDFDEDLDAGLEQEETPDTLLGADSRRVAKARYALSKALDAGQCEEALEAAEEVLDAGASPPNELLYKLLVTVADTPGVERWAQALNICTRSDVSLDVMEYAALVGKLMARDAPHAQVRTALNFGIPLDGEALELVPIEAQRESDVRHCFEGAEHLDIGELSDEDDVAALLAQRRGEAVPKKAPPKSLLLTGCTLLRRLNGEYKRVKSAADARPVYKKIEPPEHTRGDTFVYYYEPEPGEPGAEAEEWKAGWYLGTEVGGGGVTYGSCEGVSQLPPLVGTWQFLLSKGGTKEEELRFEPVQDASATKNKNKSKRVIVRHDEAQKALETVDLARLRGRVRSGEHDEGTIKYFLHFFILLHLEHMAEVAGFKGRFDFRTLSELVNFGIALADVELESVGRYNAESRRMPLPGWPVEGNCVVNFWLPRYMNQERLAFKRGESVLISRGDPLRSKVTEGSVTDVDLIGRQLSVNVHGKFPDFDKSEAFFRLDTYANRTTFERQLSALLQFVMMKPTKMQEMLIAAGVGKVDLAVLGNDGFADPGKDKGKGKGKGKGKKGKEEEKRRIEDDFVLSDEEDAKEEAEALAVADAPADAVVLSAAEEETERIKRATLALADEDAEDIDMDKVAEAAEDVLDLPDLSEAQRDAIVNSLSKRLTIVQGPPGTGKTHTSVRILTMWAKTMGYRPLLATSECNIAVDNIAEGLARNDVKVVRVGRPEKVREVLEGVCLDNMVKMDRVDREKKDDEESEVEDLPEEPLDKDSDEHRAWLEQRTKWRRRRAWNRKQDRFARARFLEEADVICATTTTAGSQALTGFKFHAILIDEVAQATETSALVPIICRGAKQIVLCGDHCQLPPSTISREAELRGMSLSLYSRLVEAGVPFRFLDTQYRAHPALMEFSAACIYNGKLLNGIDGSQRLVPAGIPWPNPDNPAAFFECNSPEGLDGESKANVEEGRYVVNLICEILDHGELTLNDIGIVAPYKGQVRTLRKLITERLPEAIHSRELEIASVDNFQGREKELIIFSAVRCNTIGSVGFLNDWRRLNVMITRARRGLVVVGNAATLCCDKHWKLWLEFTEKQGGCPEGTVKRASQLAKGYLMAAGKERMAAKLFPEPDRTILTSDEEERKERAEGREPARKRRKTRGDLLADADAEGEDEDWEDAEASMWAAKGAAKEKKKKKKEKESDEVDYVEAPTAKRKKEKKAAKQWAEDWADDEGWNDGEVPKKKKKKAEALCEAEVDGPAAGDAEETFVEEDTFEPATTDDVPEVGAKKVEANIWGLLKSVA